MGIGDIRPGLAESTAYQYATFAKRQRLSPRIRIALEAYARGDVKTLKKAAELVGVTPTALSQAKATPAGMSVIDQVERAVSDKSLSTSVLLEKLSRAAVEEIAGIMTKGEKEENRLRAAIDLADRGGETSKVHKAQVTGVTLSSEDARAIAESMVKAARLRAKYAEAAEGNFDRVNVEGKVNEELRALGNIDDSERGDEVDPAGR